MREAFINHLSFALGGQAISVEESAEKGLLISSPEVLREAGFEQHHVCAGQTTDYDLARQSVREIADSLGDIGAIVYSTCIPANGSIGSQRKFAETGDVKYLMDFPASHLQADFSLDKAVVIGLNQ